MFGWVDFRDNGKIKREKMGEKTFFVGVQLEGGREKKLVGPSIFTLNG